ncbi:glyoxalase [Cellulomonas sp. HD19AZ1]|nr:glyoxalase [Cellulomonas sp. HD19AZ1]
MDRMIVVTLPVRDLAAARAFYAGLGMRVNEELSDEHVVCVVVSGTICVMLLDHARFADVAPRPIADAHATTQVLLCLTAADRRDVDALAQAALAHGGTEVRDVQDDGPVYARAVSDPDGHVWELLHTDPAATA